MQKNRIIVTSVVIEGRSKVEFMHVKRPRFGAASFCVGRMYVVPKEIDSGLRDRAVRLVREHRSECPSLMAASAAVARQVGVGHESVRRWVLQADIDDGTSGGVRSVESAEIKERKAENARLREDVAILRG